MYIVLLKREHKKEVCWGEVFYVLFEAKEYARVMTENFPDNDYQVYQLSPVVDPKDCEVNLDA